MRVVKGPLERLGAWLRGSQPAILECGAELSPKSEVYELVWLCSRTPSCVKGGRAALPQVCDLGDLLQSCQEDARSVQWF